MEPDIHPTSRWSRAHLAVAFTAWVLFLLLSGIARA
jgi:hypothetical protein